MTEPTLSVIIATIGRPSLRHTLESVRRQRLVAGDEVLLAPDGDVPRLSGLLKEFGLPGHVLPPCLPRANDFGDSPRNLAMPLATADWLTFMDDDDEYADGAFNAIRAAVTAGDPVPHIFRMRCAGGTVLWREPELAYANVGTPMIVVPRRGPLGAWGSPLGGGGGDYAFALYTLERHGGAVVFRPEIIAVVRPQQ